MKPILKSVIFFFAKRYIAGETREEAIAVAKSLYQCGLLSTIVNLGENVTTETEGEEGVEEYLKLLEEIKKENIPSNISLKLTHLGLGVSGKLALKNAEKILKKALGFNNFVWFDMEGSRFTEAILRVFLEVKKEFPNCGIAIQSYLFRSAGDIETLIKNNAPVRVVKGAYKEPPLISFKSKKDVDGNFSAIMKRLLKSPHPALPRGTHPKGWVWGWNKEMGDSSGVHTAIATHDERLIEEAKRFTKENNISKNSFEFQMLLGIKRTLQRELAQAGYKVRIYVPYGKNYLPYTMRRLRERKENVWFVVKNIFD